MKPSRAQSVAYIKELLQNGIKDRVPNHYCWHIGRVDLEGFMDFIYGPPTTDDERLVSQRARDTFKMDEKHD